MKEAVRQKVLERRRTKHNASSRKWQRGNPDKKKASEHELNRKGGKYYQWKLKYLSIGLPGERHKIRRKHAKQYKPYKDIIAADSQIHHEWIPNTAEYRGVALVEKEPHQYGIVDVIEILDGKITLLTEEEINRGKKENEK